MGNTISYEQISLTIPSLSARHWEGGCPWSLVRIEEMELMTGLGEHMKLTVRVMLEGPPTENWWEVDYFMSLAGQWEEIELYLEVSPPQKPAADGGEESPPQEPAADGGESPRTPSRGREEDSLRIEGWGREGEGRRLRFVGLTSSLELEVQNGGYFLKMVCYSATYLMDRQKRKFTYQDSKMKIETLLQRIAARYQGGYLDPDGEGKKTGRMYLQYEETNEESPPQEPAADGGW